MVKSLGDGLLVDFVSPTAAITTADAVHHRLHRRDGMPDFTGGIVTGPAVERDGDLLGSTVNLAARLADLAPAGELRVTDALATHGDGAEHQALIEQREGESSCA